MNDYYNPVRTLQGPGCARRLPAVLREMGLAGGRVLLLIWSRSVLGVPGIAQLLAQGSPVNCRVLCLDCSNPTVEQLFRTYEETRAFSPQAVVAVGGGSILDVGKSLCCLYGKELTDVAALRELIKGRDYGVPSARWIGVPTTAGTGSEVTCWATIWDPAEDAKRSIECRDNYAYAALVDPELAQGMPLKLAVSSALDAVAHAVESYWARGTNCVSRSLALEAIRTVMSNLDGLIAGRPESHDAMSRGSMLAGLAFSNTRTTACHSISYPLTMHYHIPHGAAVSLLLGSVFRLNAPAVEGLDDLLSALDVRNGEELDARVRDALGRSGHPTCLREWGVKWEDLPHLAQLGLTRGRADNNPVELDPGKVLMLLQEIYTTKQDSRKGA